ncbi:MAG: TM2 domain-containing protein [Clostridia bacterium]
MYCRNCGKEVKDDNKLCENCQVKENQKQSEKEINEVVLEENSESVQKESPITEDVKNIQIVQEVKKEESKNKQESTINSSVIERKSKTAAGIFGIFLGSLGVHNFYLGYTGKGVAQLLMSMLSCGMLSPVSAIWGMIEGVLILTGDISKDALGNDLKE